MNKQFGQKGVENIKQAQETVVTELETEIKNTSIKLAHLVYVNDNEIVNTAAKIDEAAAGKRYTYESEMKQSVNYLIEPTRDITSVAFYLKSGSIAFFRNDIEIQNTVREEAWFQKAQQTKNHVCVGAYNIGDKNELIQNGERNTLILVYVISPNNKIDRQGKVDAVCAYQVSKVPDRIRKQNADYLNNKNDLGIMQIVDEDGKLIYADENAADIALGKIKVSTPVTVIDSIWYVESYVDSSELTRDLRFGAIIALVAAITILLLAAFFSHFFIIGIVKPVENMKDALKEVEDGNLNVRVEAQGTREVRMMSHQFNAMTKRLSSLITEYEEKVSTRKMGEEELFIKLLRGDLGAEEIKRKNRTFYNDSYALFYIRQKNTKYNITEYMERNPRFVSRCMQYELSQGIYMCYYRIHEEDYEPKILSMIENIQTGIQKEKGVSFAACISGKHEGLSTFNEAVTEVNKYIAASCLIGENAVINLMQQKAFWEEIFNLSEQFENLAKAIYVIDEKNMVQSRKELFDSFIENDIDYNKKMIYATILALDRQFSMHEAQISEVFGQEYNYIEKLDRIESIRNLKLWVTNYYAYIMDYSSEKLNINETDIIIKAKRFIANNYDNPDMKLNDVADYVGLNEKYFTNRFTKESGETFSNYLIGLRLEKAKELLRGTSFKIYEIAQMVGYHNAEHFTRTFKKTVGISPNQYRKSKEIS